MSKLLKTSLAFVAAGLLSTSALASSGAQDTSFLKKDKHHHEEMKEEKIAKEKFFSLEASYNFNEYKPKFVNQGSTTHDYEDSATFGAGFGRYLNENVSMHGGLNTLTESTYKFTSGSNTYRSDVNTTKLMVNLTYDFGSVSETKISPYVTGGIGGAYNRFDTTTYVVSGKTQTTTTYKNHDWQFAYQVGAGLAYKCPNDMRVNLGYRFADNGRAHTVPNVTTDRLQSHEIVAGLQVPF